MIKTFAEWLRVRETTGVTGGLPYCAETTPPTSYQTQPQSTPSLAQNNLMGVPPVIVQQLQKTGPAMQNIMNVANQSIKMGKHRDMTAALQAALAEYNPQHAQDVGRQQAGQTAPSQPVTPVTGTQ